MESNHQRMAFESIVDELQTLGFYLGVMPDALALLKSDAVRGKTVLDGAVPRLFEFDIEDNYESEGAELETGVNTVLSILYGAESCVRPAKISLTEASDWQEYAGLVAHRINLLLERNGMAERIYLVQFSERCWGALLTEEMAQAVRKTGSFDPEAATLYLP